MVAFESRLNPRGEFAQFNTGDVVQIASSGICQGLEPHRGFTGFVQTRQCDDEQDIFRKVAHYLFERIATVFSRFARWNAQFNDFFVTE